MEKTPPRPPDGPRLGSSSDHDAQVRQTARAISGLQARQLRQVATTVRGCLGDVPAGVRPAERHGFGHELAVGEVSCLLGIGTSAAASLVDLAVRLVSVLPQALDALESGTIDLPRARVLARQTEVLADDDARAVAASVLARSQSWEGPWDGPSPRSWRTVIDHEVVRADAEAAARRRQRAVEARRVRTWAEGDGTGVLQLRAAVADIALVDQVVTDLAHAWPPADADGVALTLDQRRADALVDVLRRVRAVGLDGGARNGAAVSDIPGLPRVPVRRVHDLGLVLHVDTLVGDGPSAREPAELRGLGPPAAVDPHSAREMARRQLESGTTVQVLVVDDVGAVQQVVVLDGPVARTAVDRPALELAVRAALDVAPPLSTGRYQPTTAITRHVHATAPTCSFYDCPRTARRCDLDHDDPWPRGPTAVSNLDPKCRRHHRHKTLGVVRTRLRTGLGRAPRDVTWTLRSGLRITTRPGPLPGCAAA